MGLEAVNELESALVATTKGILGPLLGFKMNLAKD